MSILDSNEDSRRLKRTKVVRFQIEYSIRLCTCNYGGGWYSACSGRTRGSQTLIGSLMFCCKPSYTCPLYTRLAPNQRRQSRLDQEMRQFSAEFSDFRPWFWNQSVHIFLVMTSGAASKLHAELDHGFSSTDRPSASDPMTRRQTTPSVSWTTTRRTTSTSTSRCSYSSNHASASKFPIHLACVACCSIFRLGPLESCHASA